MCGGTKGMPKEDAVRGTRGGNDKRVRGKGKTGEHEGKYDAEYEQNMSVGRRYCIIFISYQCDGPCPNINH